MIDAREIIRYRGFLLKGVVVVNKVILSVMAFANFLASEVLANDQELIINSLEPFSNQIITKDVDSKKIKVLGSNIEINSFLGQYSSARLRIVSKNKHLEGLTLSFEEETGAKIPSVDVDFYIVKEWYQAGGAWLAVGKPLMFPDRKILVPELLLKDENLVKVDYQNKINYLRINIKGIEKYYSISNAKPKTKKSIDYFSPEYEVNEATKLKGFDLEKGVAKQVWVTINIASSVAPGKYKGKMLIKKADVELGSIELTLNVFPIELPEPGLEYSMYYHGRLHYGGKTPSVSSEYKTEEQLLNEFKDMREHGVSYPVIYQDPFKDAGLFNDYLKLLLESGLRSDKVYMIYLNTRSAVTESQLDSLENRFNLVRSMTTKFGVENVYVYGIDEAKKKRLVRQKPAWKRIQQIGGKMFVAGYQGTYEAMGDALDLLVFAQSPMQEEAKKYHAIGKKIFSYANPQVGVESPYIFRRNYGLQLWASGFDGAMLYAYQHFMGDGWNDFDHPVYRDHNFVYSASSAIIGTIAWEGFRAGVNDVRYLTLLEKKINIFIHQEGNLGNIAREAKAYLTKLKKKVNSYNQYGKYTKSYFIDLDKIRNKVVGYILRLKG